MAGGALNRARFRATVARETPSEAQIAAVIPGAGARAATASVTTRRRPASAPARPPLFLDINDGLRPGQAPRKIGVTPL